MAHDLSLTGVLLAGGAARRFGANKLLATLPTGQTIGLFAATKLAAVVDRVLVVVRAEDHITAAAFENAGYAVMRCGEAKLGMGHSLGCGVAASRASAAWMVALADMPLIAPVTLAALVTCWRDEDRIVVPRCAGQAGHPVIFPARYRDELLVLQGDRGARPLLDAHRDDIFTFVTHDTGVLRDIDTPEDLVRASHCEQ